MFSKVSTPRLFSGLVAASLLVTGLPVVSVAQSTPGLTIFSGRDRKDQLSYHLDFGGRRGQPDRYRLRIPSQKVNLAVSQININYPDYYQGEFDPKDVEIVYQGKTVRPDEVKWNKENFLLEIYLKEPIPAKTGIEVQLSNVQNPDFGGTFYFDCTLISPGDQPLPRFVGTWIISVS